MTGKVNIPAEAHVRATDAIRDHPARPAASFHCRGLAHDSLRAAAPLIEAAALERFADEIRAGIQRDPLSVCLTDYEYGQLNTADRLRTRAAELRGGA